MAEKKLTNKELFEMVKAELTSPELVAFIDSRIALIDKKAAAPRKKQVNAANEAVKPAILEALAANGPMRATDLAKAVGLETSQKVTGIVRSMIDAGQVERFTEKRVTYYKVA